MRALWPVVGVVAIASAGWGVWSMVAARKADATAAVRETLSPADAKQREILKANIDRAGDPLLGEMYQDLNVKHFAAALHGMPVRWEPRLAEVGALAQQAFTLEGMFGRIGPKTAILLNTSLQRDSQATKRALCHEMVHAYLATIGDSGTGHGPEFQGVLRRLAQEGAFEGIVATEADRSRLRAWLDEESARLDIERADVDRLSAEIEAERVEVESAFADLNARVAAANANTGAAPTASDIAAVQSRRDAYNQRAADANTRVERDRAALAAFNREVERYNLMLVYPDGMDEGARVTPKTVIR